MNLAAAARMLPASLVFLAAGCAAGFAPGDAASRGKREPGAQPPEEEPFDAPDAASEAIGGAVFPGGPSMPRDAVGLAMSADFAVRQHRLEDAAPLFEAAIRAAPSGESWRYERALADVYLGLRRNVESERIYTSLITGGAHPRSSTLSANLAVARYRLGDSRGAREAADAALQLNAGNVEALKTLGLVDLLDGQRERGAKRLQAALATNPRIPEAQVALAQLEADAGDVRAAAARYRKLLEWLPSALQTDYHRRWRDLFYPAPRPTDEELKARIAALETSPVANGSTPTP